MLQRMFCAEKKRSLRSCVRRVNIQPHNVAKWISPLSANSSQLLLTFSLLPGPFWMPTCVIVSWTRGHVPGGSSADATHAGHFSTVWLGAVIAILTPQVMAVYRTSPHCQRIECDTQKNELEGRRLAVICQLAQPPAPYPGNLGAGVAACADR